MLPETNKNSKVMRKIEQEKSKYQETTSKT